MQLWLYYQHRGLKHLVKNINIDKVTTYINYVMVTNMVLEKFVSIISIWVIKEICC